MDLQRQRAVLGRPHCESAVGCGGLVRLVVLDAVQQEGVLRQLLADALLLVPNVGQKVAYLYGPFPLVMDEPSAGSDAGDKHESRAPVEYGLHVRHSQTVRSSTVLVLACRWMISIILSADSFRR